MFKPHFSKTFDVDIEQYFDYVTILMIMPFTVIEIEYFEFYKCEINIMMLEQFST